MVVNKITWAKVGGITKPGRYMFRFGWLTITAEDLAIWQQLPNAEFTLVPTIPATVELGSEFRLGPSARPKTKAGNRDLALVETLSGRIPAPFRLTPAILISAYPI